MAGSRLEGQGMEASLFAFIRKHSNRRQPGCLAPAASPVLFPALRKRIICDAAAAPGSAAGPHAV